MPLTVSPRRSRRGPLVLAVIAIAGLIIPGAVWAAKPPPPAPVDIQVLNVSDWHGNLDPVGTVGGAWNLSARFKQDRTNFGGPTLTLTAGDDFGAAPPLSGYFDEVPAVLAERLMGIQVNTFGNHDFDRGVSHLQDMINLAGAPTDADHPGAPFGYVAANLSNLSANLTGVSAMQMFNMGHAKVAVIGIVNEEAPGLVDPGAFGTMTVTSGVDAANKYAAQARKAGANAVFVITHKGVDNVSGGTATGALINFVNGLTPGLVDVVFGDHTNISYSGTVNGVLTFENISFGQQYSRTHLTVQPGKGGGVSAKSQEFVSPGPAGKLSTDFSSCTTGGATATYCDQAIVDMLVPYRAELAAKLDGVIAQSDGIFDRGGNIERSRETPLGDLIADAMNAPYGTQFGYMNGGGIRAQLPSCNYAPLDTTLHRSNYAADHTTINACGGGTYAAGAPYDIVLGDLGAVQTFNNLIITRSVTGIQLWQMLENGVSLVNSGTGIGTKGRFPQISGFKFTFDYSLPTGCTGPIGDPTDPTGWTGGCVPSRVTSVSFPGGAAIPYDNTVYSIATLNFINNGGDGYTVLADGAPIVTRDSDVNVMLAYITSLTGNLDPADYPAGGRITKICSLCP